ncbi:hypothetical protein ES708_02984 [subsurface metagenome]
MKETVRIPGFAACILIAVMFIASPVHADNPLKGRSGMRDFDARLSIALHGGRYTLVTHLANKSTDKSNRCDRCPKGSASALISYELWNPDGGRFWSGRLNFKDICNGTRAKREDVLKKLAPRYGEIEIRWDVTTPNGSHSFHKGSARYKLK